ncbi:MAG: DEAD/DEAH box helicase [Gemmataceae bacterium]|nr:DEAD/DEAH box helicase [Gemmataceae bacterium]MCI0741364.1 DEAD/DEAH box helicase [Gemmataceae bacterium]
MEPIGFAALSLSDSVLSAVQRAGFVHPTPIQVALIPPAVEGVDVIGQAQTGTGKTAAFLLPFLTRWRPRTDPGPQALVLTPTRELTLQVAEEAVKLSPHKGFRVVPILGGQRMGQQVRALKQGANLVVGTPGRVIDHLGRGTLSFARTHYVVLDEADRMLDIGFRPDIEKILRRCPSERQTLFLSATLPPPVLRLAHRYMREPLHLNLSPEKLTVEKIRQSYFTVDEDRKFELLMRVLEREKPRQCIIFCETKIGSHHLFQQLRGAHKRVAVMHGDLPQEMRNRIMQYFREGKVVILVATDVVGRGIDVMGISHIINYDLPSDAENYVHRIGRTGRMGNDGVAITFVTMEQGEELTRIEALINNLVAQDQIEGFESFRPRAAAADTPKQYTPVYGDRVKRYSRRL